MPDKIMLSLYSVLPEKENQKESQNGDCPCELVYMFTAVNCTEVCTKRAHEDIRNYPHVIPNLLIDQSI